MLQTSIIWKKYIRVKKYTSAKTTLCEELQYHIKNPNLPIRNTHQNIEGAMKVIKFQIALLDFVKIPNEFYVRKNGLQLNVITVFGAEVFFMHIMLLQIVSNSQNSLTILETLVSMLYNLINMNT